MKESVSTGGALQILGKASEEAGLSLKASGSHTTRSSTQVTDTISNTTKKNANLVFYAGWTSVKGTYRWYDCDQVDSRDPQRDIFYIPGQRQSYAVYGDGAVRCGAGGALNSLQKLALKVGCR